MSPAPKHVNMTPPTSKSKPLPRAKVAPTLHSQAKEELLPPPTKQEENDYMVPEDECPDVHNLKLGENETILVYHFYCSSYKSVHTSKASKVSLNE